MRFSHQSLADRQSAVFCPLICPLHSKKSVDEGAAADPEVRKINALSVRKTMMIGSSQNFFRSFKKPQSSRIKSPTSFLLSMALQLVLMVHMRCRPLTAGDPIRCRISVEVPAHGVVASEAEDGSNWYDQAVVRKSKDESRIQPADHFTDGHPKAKERF